MPEPPRWLPWPRTGGRPAGSPTWPRTGGRPAGRLLSCHSSTPLSCLLRVCLRS